MKINQQGLSTIVLAAIIAVVGVFMATTYYFWLSPQNDTYSESEIAPEEPGYVEE